MLRHSLCLTMYSHTVRDSNSMFMPSYLDCSPMLTVYAAPLVWLDVNETYFPGDIYGQVRNTYPAVNYTRITGYTTPLTLDNLNQLNNFGNKSVYLTSNEGIEAFPAWFNGTQPNNDGVTEDATSCAIVTVDHGDGTLDAFYFYFYP